MKALTAILFLLSMALAALATLSPDISVLPSLAIDGTTTTYNDLPLPRAAADVFPVGLACTNEGDWNCLTTAFQRCAEGTWTAAQPVAAGTECMPVGISHNSSSEGPPVFSIGLGGGGSVPTPSASKSASVVTPSESLFTATITTTYTTTQTSSTGPLSSVSVVTTTVTTIVIVTETPDASASASKSAAASSGGGGVAPKAEESGAGRVWEGAAWALLEFLVLVAAWL